MVPFSKPLNLEDTSRGGAWLNQQTLIEEVQAMLFAVEYVQGICGDAMLLQLSAHFHGPLCCGHGLEHLLQLLC
jgi:hypothetical protein